MMYNNKLVAVIKVDGKILRERGETVYIPFGAEYSISFKNLHSTDAVVDITIDGEDVLDGSSLVVRKNSDNSIEGFMKGNDVSHKFKFIEKTEQISEYRGDKISDGLIRIAFRFEKEKTVWFSSGGYYNRPSFRDNDIRYGSSGDADWMRLQSRSVSYDSQVSSNVAQTEQLNDDGITVKGGQSNQSFVTTTVGALEDREHVIVFQLKGETNTGQVIKQPILVKTKVRCETCGNMSVPKHKFCGNCGTSLVV